ncbi:MAG: peptidoglycan-binding domain-containing protein [Candidatus Sulfotelmatobacter sp.]
MRILVRKPSTMRQLRPLATTCALALSCLVFSSNARAQSPGSGDVPAAKDSPKTPKTAKTKTAKKPITQHTPSTKNSSAKTGKSAAKPHTTSRLATGSYSKSIVARTGSTRTSSRRVGKKRTVARGQQKIDPERAEAIQEALIREHYMTGEPTGTWNEASEGAMRRYQADHGWQSKTVPDARALISLGLGPNHDHLLNPESAMTTGPESPTATSLTPASQSAAPGAPVSANSKPRY